MKKFTVLLISLMLILAICPAAYAEEEPEAVYAQSTVYLNAADVSAPSVYWYAWTWGVSGGRWVRGACLNDGQFRFDGVESNLVFACMYTESEPSWDSKTMWKQTVDLSCDGIATELVLTGMSSAEVNKLTGYWRVFDSSDVTVPTDPAYYTEPSEATQGTTEPQTPWEPHTDATAPLPTQSTYNTAIGGEDKSTDPTAPACCTQPTQKSTQSTRPAEIEQNSNNPKGSPDALKPSLNLSTATVKCGKVITLKVKNGGGKITYSSGNRAVAKVSSKGKVSALKRGFSKITVKVGGKKLYFTIKVTSSPKLSKTSVTVKKGGSVKIKITGKASTVKNNYAGTKYAAITSKRTATTVKIVGKKRGSTKVRIRVNGVLFKVKVKVK